MRSLFAIFYKQLLDTKKNNAVLIQFFMFPLMALLMERMIQIAEMPPHFFAKMFACMFVGMAPLVCMSSVLAEEKERGTLRVLFMSGVKSWQYLISIGSFIFCMCMIGTAVFALLCAYRGWDAVAFVCIMTAGIILSELVGAVIGICCQNQMAATGVTVPVMLVFSFVPMLSEFNTTVATYTDILFSQQIRTLINHIGIQVFPIKSICILAGNFFAVLAVFLFVSRKKGLE